MPAIKSSRYFMYWWSILKSKNLSKEHNSISDSHQVMLAVEDRSGARRELISTILATLRIENALAKGQSQIHIIVPKSLTKFMGGPNFSFCPATMKFTSMVCCTARC
jgi:hypothetical protein